jgi:hypothetical protein
MRPEPVLRRARLPELPMPATGSVMHERVAWLRDLSLRAVYVGEDCGWFGTPIGHAELDRWLERLGDAVAAGDYAGAQSVTRDVLLTARRAAVPVIACVTLVDAVGQAVSAALAERSPGSDEPRERARLFNALRRVALE